MKKIIFSLIIGLLIIPIICFGQISLGRSGSAYTCTVWRDNLGLPYIDTVSKGKSGNWCEGDSEQNIRIYELEVAVQELQAQIAQNNVPSAVVCDNSGFNSIVSRVQSLENRMSTVEQAIERLNKTIGDSLRSIITILISKNK